MTNYEFWWDGGPWDLDDIPIGCVSREEWQRPDVGTELNIKGAHVKVTRTSPSGNPAGQKVIYYVERVNGNAPYKENK